MASVRMTNDLRSTVCRSASKAYGLANPEPQPSNEYVAAVRAAILNSPEQTFLRYMQKLGAEFNVDKGSRVGDNILPYAPSDAPTGIDLRIKQKTGNRIVARQEYKEVTILFNTPFTERLQVNVNGHRWGYPTVWIDDLSNEDKTKIIEYFEAHNTAEEEYRTSRRVYESSIRDLLDKCTTLKQLLEIWPAAESLVPADKIQKMHTKVTRIQRAAEIKEEVSFDPTIANQAVLTAKMLGG